jgi:hypothetical protein
MMSMLLIHNAMDGKKRLRYIHAAKTLFHTLVIDLSPSQLEKKRRGAVLAHVPKRTLTSRWSNRPDCRTRQSTSNRSKDMLRRIRKLGDQLIDPITKHGKGSQRRDCDQQSSDCRYQRRVDSAC